MRCIEYIKDCGAWHWRCITDAEPIEILSANEGDGRRLVALAPDNPYGDKYPHTVQITAMDNMLSEVEAQGGICDAGEI